MSSKKTKLYVPRISDQNSLALTVSPRFRVAIFCQTPSRARGDRIGRRGRVLNERGDATRRGIEGDGLDGVLDESDRAVAEADIGSRGVEAADGLYPAFVSAVEVLHALEVAIENAKA